MKKIRVLVGKPGLDGHDRGAKVVAAALRDAGMEVIYTGLHQTCEAIVEAAIQEDVDVVGLSILSGAHMTIFPKILNLLKEKKAKIPVIGGGIRPQDDIKKLERMGVKKLFGPGTPTTEIVNWINNNIAKSKVPEKKKSAIKKKKKN
ncbi:MAG: cobalamin B12-binding domain-containing protein [candidate division WOR-3 bacterium]